MGGYPLPTLDTLLWIPEKRWRGRKLRNPNSSYVRLRILYETLLAPEEARGQQRDGSPVKYSGEELPLQRYTAGLYWVSRRIRDNIPRTEWKGNEKVETNTQRKKERKPNLLLNPGSELSPKLRHWKGSPEVNRARAKIPPHNKMKRGIWKMEALDTY